MQNRLSRVITLSCFTCWSLSVPATVHFSDSFSTADGNLVGYNSWAQSGVGPPDLLITGGRVGTSFLGSGQTGQDASHALSGVPTANGTSFYYGMDLTVSAASSTGDYFVNLVSGAANVVRLHAKSSGTGFVLGLQGNGATTTTYGSELLFGTTYRIVAAYDRITGASNDNLDLYVNPSLPRSGNTPYTTQIISGTEPGTIGSVIFRQNRASVNERTPAATIDNLVISSGDDGFLEAVPEPANVALGIFACGLVLVEAGRRVRRNRQVKQA